MGIRWVRATPVAVLLMLLVGLAACTNDAPTAMEPPEASPPAPTPATPPGARVGVVLPPTSEVDAGVSASIDAQLVRLAATTDETVSELRGYAAADPRFVEDLARWLAERGTELVCVLGDRAEDVVVPLARLYPGGRFCALPAGPPSPDEAGATPDSDGILRVDLRIEELGHLVGVAARTQAQDAPVGLLLGGDELPDQRFRLGLLAGLAGTQVVEADVPSGQDVSLTDRAEAVLAAGAEVVVVDGGGGASEAVAVIGDRAEVLAPSAVLIDAATTDVALRWSVRWDRALVWPLNEMAGAPGTAQHTSVGLTEDVFEVLVGDGASDAVGVALEVASDGLIAGSIDPATPSSPEPDTDTDTEPGTQSDQDPPGSGPLPEDQGPDPRSDDPEARGPERRAPASGEPEPANPEPVETVP